MEVFKIEITSWTSSFRYPNLISGFQATLEVPPLSTILGLLNAAAGNYLEFQNLEIGYYFKFGGKAVDLETIYQIQSDKGRPTNNAKSNIINREFLFDNYLAIYLKDENLVSVLKNPYYPIVLGRMNDLASINNIQKIKLTTIEKANKIKGQIIPFRDNYLPGQIQALPKYFSNTIPRQNLGTEPYSIINFNVNDFDTNILAYRDSTIDKKGVDIYFHKYDFDYQ